MIKYATIALFLLAVASTNHAQNRADTSIALSVYNTGVSFKLMPADFGGVITTSLVATMVASYDTVMVLKDTGQILLSQQLKGVTIGNFDITTAEWANGTYILSLQTGKEIKTKTFVVQH